jgi:hypothetical protein
MPSFLHRSAVSFYNEEFDVVIVNALLARRIACEDGKNV